MNELVVMKNKQVVTSTTNVAINFNKRHDNVIRDVESLKKDVLNFEEMFFKDTEPDSYGRERKIYLMNRDGFTLLAMGFTGKKAIQFKLKYIEAFNKMEQQLKELNKPSYMIHDPVKRAEKWIDEYKEKQKLESENKKLKPKASYHDTVIQSSSLLSVTQIAKDYGMGAPTLNKILHELGVQYKQGGTWFLYHKYQDKGYTHSKTHVIDSEKSTTHTYWTQKGKRFIYEILKEKKGILPVTERENKQLRLVK